MSHWHPSDENKLLAALPASELALLLPHLTEVRLERGQVLQEADAPVRSVWFPRSGMVSLVAVMQSGTLVETAVIGREGAIGTFAGSGPWSGSIQAVVQLPGHGLVISAARVEEIAWTRPSIRDLILRYRESLLLQVQQTAACNALHSLECRLARWLLQAQDRVGDERLALTQDLLSQMLGVRRTSVTLIAGKLHAAGLIRQHRAHVEITDRPGLEKTACECYAALRRRTAALLPGEADDDSHRIEAVI